MTQITQLRTGARAVTTDGKSSHVLALVVDTGSATVTHLVIRNADAIGTGRLVPLGHVQSVSPDLVTLDISLKELLDLGRFIVPGRLPGTRGGEGLMAYWLGRPGDYTWVGHESPPAPSDVVMRSDFAVQDASGHSIGTADEVLTDPSGRITGVLLRRGPLLGHRDLLIPADAIASFDDHCVRLNLEKAALDRLQAVDHPGE